MPISQYQQVAAEADHLIGELSASSALKNYKNLALPQLTNLHIQLSEIERLLNIAVEKNQTPLPPQNVMITRMQNLSEIRQHLKNIEVEINERKSKAFDERIKNLKKELKSLDKPQKIEEDPDVEEASKLLEEYNLAGKARKPRKSRKARKARKSKKSKKSRKAKKSKTSRKTRKARNA